MSGAEKKLESLQSLRRQSVLCSPVWRAEVGENGPNLQISRDQRREFSVVQTCWRSEWDSNRPYRSVISGFGRCLILGGGRIRACSGFWAGFFALASSVSTHENPSARFWRCRQVLVITDQG